MRQPNVNEGNRNYAVPILSAVILAVLLLILLPPFMTAHVKTEALRLHFLAENEARKTLAQIIGGFVIIAGAYLGFRRVQAAEKNVQVMQEGQITERFTRAVDQLGSDKIQIRLGGIYALERIAKDSEKDHWTIMEILTAYIRENANLANYVREQVNQPRQLSIGLEKEEQVEDHKENAFPKPSVDIQAALTVIGRRKLAHEDEDTPRLDIRATDLRGANLEEAHLEQARLEGTHLERAALEEAHLEGARLKYSHLEGADLTRAHLEEADLFAAHLEGADLSGAYLKQAQLQGAHLERADLLAADLEGADLSGAYLKGTSLQQAHLEYACLMMMANMEETYFLNAHMDGTYLKGTDLKRAKGLRQEQIDSANIDENTELPDYLAERQESETDSRAAGKAAPETNA